MVGYPLSVLVQVAAGAATRAERSARAQACDRKDVLRIVENSLFDYVLSSVQLGPYGVKLFVTIGSRFGPKQDSEVARANRDFCRIWIPILSAVLFQVGDLFTT